MKHYLRTVIGLLVGFALIATACGGSGDSTATDPDAGEEVSADGESGVESDDAGEESGEESDADAAGFATHVVPDDFPTIQSAVDAASSGDLIMLSPGTYSEAVDVTTDDLVIRGMDRNTVILDGNFELENGIRVIGADGVAVENMTAMNYTKNGFFWTSDVTGYRASYLTAIRNGDYGLYAFGARDGLIEHSYASGSPDAGFYIGQCYPCNSVITDVISEYNGLGYSGTNSGGDLFIINSTWRHNRAGIVPNSGSYEGCAPERETTIVGNIVHSNSNPETAAIDAALLAMGNGIALIGGIDNLVERNLIWDHDISGIAVAPFPEDNPINGIPDDYPVDCLENAIPALPDDAASLPGTLFWEAQTNVVRGNVITDSRTADIIVVQSAEHGNRFCDNDIATTLPTDLETLAPCEGELQNLGGEAFVAFFDILESTKPPSVDYKSVDLPDPGPQPNMPDAETAEPVPARAPEFPDTASITVPDAPE